MLNRSGIKRETYASGNQILADIKSQYSVGVVVSSAIGVTVGQKKIVKAGTPITGSLDARSTPFTAAVTSGTAPNETSTAIGVLLQDIDVTDGNANGTLLLSGVVNKSRLDTATKALITAPVQKVLTGIRFISL
jgi:hypothetical protein